MYVARTKSKNSDEVKARRARRERLPLPQAPTWIRTQLMGAALAVALVSALLYLPILRHPFISFDDREYVTENSQIKAGMTWQTFLWAWTSLDHANWHPLTWISHAADVQLFGMAPAGHHLTSILFHAANTALLFLFLTQATRSPGRALAVASLFAVHPLNVESVAWVAERKTLLSAFWSLLGLLTYVSYARHPSRMRLAGVTALLFLALASKPMAVTMPFLLLLLDRWPLERVVSWKELLSNKRVWVEKIPLFTLSAVSCVVTVIAQHRSSSIATIESFPLLLRLENAIVSYGFYSVKLVWPSSLAFLYPWPSDPALTWEFAAAIIFLIGTTAIAWKEREQRPYLMVGWLWFLGVLVPVIGIIQVGTQSRADRYAYFPMIGLLTVGVWLAGEVRGQIEWRPKLGVALIVVVTLALSICSRRQMDYWRSNYDLWLHAFQVTTDNYLAADKVGIALQDAGRRDEAMSYFETALRINAADPLANFNVGVNWHLQGRVKDAIGFYQITANQDTDPILRAEAFENMGTAYRQLGELQPARDSYLKALQYDPKRSRIYDVLREMDAHLTPEP